MENSKKKKFNNKSRKSNGKESNPKGGRAAYERKDKCDSPEAANDVSWYAQNAQLLADAASIPYSNALGPAVTRNNAGFAHSSVVSTTNTIPGLCAYRIMPIPGIGKDALDPVTVAARNVYSFVRHQNSGHSNYDAPDLMMYMLGMDQAYIWWSFMVRLYGVARLYTQKNRYYPSVLIKAMGVDFDDIIGNLANLRAFINVYATKMSTMRVPNTMAFFKRHLWLFQNIYLDKPMDKSQTYLFVPDGYYKVNVTGSNGTQLDYTRLVSTLKLADIINVANEILEPLYRNEDFNIMSGDILKAYGADKVYGFLAIPEDFTVMPAYSEEVLSQIHNATILNASELTNTSITQNTAIGGGEIIFQPHFTGLNAGFDMDQFLNLYKTDITPGDTMVATRLKCYASRVADTQNMFTEWVVESAGTELVTKATIYTIGTNGEASTSDYFTNSMLITSSSDPSAYLNNNLNVVTPLSIGSVFDWVPIMTAWTVTQADTNYTVTGSLIFGDLQNYTTLSNTTFTKMNTTALLSMFNIPYMG